MSTDYLLKTEPSEYSFADPQKDGVTVWDGVSNPTAVKNLREMEPGARLVIYETGERKCAVGTATVVSVDASDPKMPIVKIKAGQAIAKPWSLTQIKANKLFADSPLVREGRLSVVPLTKSQYKGCIQQVDATPSDINLLFKGGVYGSRETGRAFCGATNGPMVPLEGGSSRCIRSGAHSASRITPFIVFCRITVGLFRRPVGARLLALTVAEREDISRGLASGSSIREIAKRLERAASTVSREVARHGGRPEYRANEADQRAWESALRPKRCLLAIHVKLQKIVASKLILDWSPEQISGWLKIQYPDDESMRVSHETIYRSLFIQARGALKKELVGHLRSKRRIRRSQHSRIFKDSRGQIVDAISIRERPAEIEDRAVPGHWEGDLIGGTKNSHIATLVERHSRFTALVKVHSKDTAVVVAALSRQIRRLPSIPAALVDLGSRAGDGQTQDLHRGHQCESLLL